MSFKLQLGRSIRTVLEVCQYNFCTLPNHQTRGSNCVSDGDNKMHVDYLGRPYSHPQDPLIAIRNENNIPFQPNSRFEMCEKIIPVI